MRRANAVHFPQLPSVILGQSLAAADARIVSDIQVIAQEYEDHSEMIIDIYSGKMNIATYVDCPCMIEWYRGPFTVTREEKQEGRHMMQHISCTCGWQTPWTAVENTDDARAAAIQMCNTTIAEHAASHVAQTKE